MPQDAEMMKRCTDQAKVLKSKRTNWEPQWRELSRFVNPNRGQFLRTPNQRDNGQQKDQSVLDDEARAASEIMVAGLMGGLTSPTRPWFRLAVPDLEVGQLSQVRTWLDHCGDRMRMVFNSGNTYAALPTIYEELGTFGSAAAIMEPDREDVFRIYTMSCGEYWLGVSYRGTVERLYREFMYSHRQLVERWGEEARPESTQKKGQQDYDSEIRICQLLEPNIDYDTSRLDWRGKPFRSIYWADGHTADGAYISLKGYTRWPVLSPRWKPIGNEAYSKGPGHNALANTKSLQVLTKREHNVVDKHANPPMGAHISLKGSASSVLPGAINYFTTAEKGAGMWPLYQTEPGAVDAIEKLVQRMYQKIHRAFFADIFLMISDMEGVQPRNQLELQLRKEEKMLMLGPVLESLHDELLQPLISWAFDEMMLQRLFLPPPEELHGMPLDIELISVLAQAQKAASLGSIERVFAFAGSIAGAKPEVLDKLDADTAVDRYAEDIGAPADIIVGEDEVKKIRAQRQLEQQQAAAAARAQQLAEGAKTLSQTEVGGGRNALQAVTGL